MVTTELKPETVKGRATLKYIFGMEKENKLVYMPETARTLRDWASGLKMTKEDNDRYYTGTYEDITITEDGTLIISYDHNSLLGPALIGLIKMADESEQ